MDLFIHGQGFLVELIADNAAGHAPQDFELVPAMTRRNPPRRRRRRQGSGRASELCSGHSPRKSQCNSSKNENNQNGPSHSCRWKGCQEKCLHQTPKRPTRRASLTKGLPLPTIQQPPSPQSSVQLRRPISPQFAVCSKSA